MLFARNMVVCQTVGVKQGGQPANFLKLHALLQRRCGVLAVSG